MRISARHATTIPNTRAHGCRSYNPQASNKWIIPKKPRNIPPENSPPHIQLWKPGPQFASGQPQPPSKNNRRKIIHHPSPNNRKIPFASQNPATILMFRPTRPSPAALAAIAAGAATGAATINCFPQEVQYWLPELNGVPHRSQYMNCPPATQPLVYYYAAPSKKFHLANASLPRLPGRISSTCPLPRPSVYSTPLVFKRVPRPR